MIAFPTRRAALAGAVCASLAFTAARGQPLPAARPLSDAQLQKILDIMAAAGAIRPIVANVVSVLGIGRDDQALTCVQIAYSTDGKHDHTIGKLENQLGYVLSFQSYGQVQHVYYADNTLTFMRAVTVDDVHGVALVPEAIARSEMDGELTFWAKAVDADFK